MGTDKVSDEEVFRSISAFYMENYALPPLGAKIYTLLMLDYKYTGITFDEIVAQLGASKSSVSESIRLLLSKHLIIEKCFENERKRHFFKNPDHAVVRFESILKRLNKELSVIEQIQSYHREKSTDIPEPKIEIFKKMLKNNIKNIDDTINKLKQYEN